MLPGPVQRTTPLLIRFRPRVTAEVVATLRSAPAFTSRAPDPVSAVRGFLDAAKEPDLQAMSVLFGDTQGAARDGLPREELEKRELIMVRCLRHDRYNIVNDAPAPGGGRTFSVNMNFRGLSRSSNFQVVKGPSNRWYVQKFDLGALNDICTQRT